MSRGSSLCFILDEEILQNLNGKMYDEFYFFIPFPFN
jgi:hypothetical protein